MKIQRSFPAFTVTKKAEKALKEGHPWVYDTEITAGEDCENGALADIFSQKGSYLGTGFLSLNSKIRIRRLSDNANETFGPEFFARRVKYAIDYRRTVMRDDFGACRLIFGEADGLPGLTADRYGGIISAQVLSYGMELRKDIVYRAICDELAADGVKVTGIMERNDAAIRKLEGLNEYKGWYTADHLPSPPSPVTEITENGIIYSVDTENGQKTGFFLDQKYNRLAVMKLAKGMKVLDCFTHTGS
ncbi:MAG: class I SAM-dependent rRNA methyltransferase, partial [Ruminiclostridium sp.]|nr:class I SAM-dependent rRNA methyltransferase [Ruminiclostridium sp.]